MIKRTKEADPRQESPKLPKNLINQDLINPKPLDHTPDLPLQNLRDHKDHKDQPRDLGHAPGQGLVLHPGPDLGLDLDQSADTEDHTADLDLEVEAVDIILVPDQGVLIHKVDVDTLGVGEMDTMTDEEDTTELTASPRCPADGGLVGADSGIRIIQNHRDVLVCLV